MTFKQLTQLNEKLEELRQECRKWTFEKELDFDVEVFKNEVTIIFEQTIDYVFAGTEFVMWGDDKTIRFILEDK